LNGGTCTPGAGGTFTCTCSGGFTGPNCQAGSDLFFSFFLFFFFKVLLGLKDKKNS